MAEGGKRGWDWLWALAIIAFLIAAAVQHLFGPPGPSENSTRNILIRHDEQEVADAQLMGDEDSAAWWHRRAQIDAARP